MRKQKKKKRKMKTVEITKEIFKKFPKLNIGILIVRGITNKGESKALHILLKEVGILLKTDFVSEKLAKHKLISPWRSAFLAFGSEPHKHHSSVESLMRKVLDGKDVFRKNKLVDIYNYFSLKYLIPLGGDDLDQVVGDIKLTIAEGTENFVPSGEGNKQNPDKGEVIYKDEVEVLCRKWNWKECYKTRITENTKNAILYVEGIPPVTKKELEKLLNELKSLIKLHCGGDITPFILTKTNPTAEF
ncbi:MAG: phenylalanine--tRNA ligase beta subunit-related protein [Candidatus Woesearchaeota archaeon]|jgi:lysyl-tRNA synthetase class 2|nr:phenylalanine--tRNA ligase beta subunit-related protein [Candidatus Woesearchaeota archaeon]